MKIQKVTTILVLVVISLATNIYARNIPANTITKKHVVFSKQNEDPIAFMRNFFKWYKTKVNSFQNDFVDMDSEKPNPYRINFNKTEKYLTVLKSSGFFSDSYINYFRAYFKKVDVTLQKSKQNDGPIDGLDYDLVMHTQEPITYLKDLSVIQLTIIKSTANSATIKMQTKFDRRNYNLIDLVKVNNKYLIDKIGDNQW